MKYGWIPVILLSLFLTGCAADAVSTSRSTNPAVPVSLLFEHEGCKVYRFADNGNYHYYANCKGSSVTTLTDTQTEGKATVPNQMTTNYQ
jgi:hypothetical protein